MKIHDRPASFDKRLMDYLPSLRKLALRLNPENSEDLVHDTIAWALTKWENFRGDPCARNSGFYSWLSINMREINQAKRSRISAKATHVDCADANLIAPAAQEYAVQLAQVLSMLDHMGSDTRDTVLTLVRDGSLSEITAKHGVCRRAASMRVQRARRDLLTGNIHQSKPYRKAA